jgi:uncharacterized protein (TIGR00369 family)
MTKKEIDVERLWRDWQTHTPFEQLVRMELVSWDAEEGKVVIRLPFRDEYRRSDRKPGVHGGVIATLIDIAADFAVCIRTGVLGVPTINLRVDYLSMASNSELTAAATVVRAGRTIAVADVEVTSASGRKIAVGRGTYSAKEG